MSTVERSSDFGTPYLQKLREYQFESYYRGFVNTFLQLVGIAVTLHSNDPSSNPPPHLAAWLRDIGSVLQAGSRLRYDLRVARELEAAVPALVRDRLRSGTQADALVNGGMPDRSNVELFSALAWAVGMCIVWYEEIEGELVTRIYCRPNEHEWLFYAYMGFDGRKVYCFDHPSLRNHVADSPTGSCFQTSTQPTPIVIGRLMGAPESQNPPQTMDIPMLQLLLRMAALADPATVSEGHRKYFKELKDSWGNVYNCQVPALQAVGLDLVKAAIDQGASDPRPKSPEIPPLSHHLRDCKHYPHHDPKYIQHINHQVHESCLRNFLLSTITTNPSNAVICPVCPNVFSEAFILQVMPHYQTIKENAFRKLQETVTKSLLAS